MDIFSLVLIGIGLAMDATAVSIAKGMCMDKKQIAKYSILLGLAFGIFQGIMPMFGYFLGSAFAGVVQNVDHWIAFILLSAIGINMLRESRNEQDACEVDFSLSLSQILILALATSIDALAIGVSFAFLKVNIFVASAIIASTTFLMSFIGVRLGKRVGGLFERYAEMLGGFILICLGVKILVEHLFF